MVYLILIIFVLMLIHARPWVICPIAAAIAMYFYSKSSAQDHLKTTGGGILKPMTIDTSTLKNPWQRYTKHRRMAVRRCKKMGISSDGSFEDILYRIYKHVSPAKKWGNRSHINLSMKLGEDIMQIIGNIPKGTVVDYGCGKGDVIQYFNEQGHETICIDVEDFRDSPQSTFIKNNNNDAMYGFEDNSIDLMLCLQSIHHTEFINGGIPEFIKTVTSKIKQGGYLLIREHNARSADDLYTVVLEHILNALQEINNKGLSRSELKHWVSKYNISDRAWYFSKSDMHNLLTDCGMRLVIKQHPGANPSHTYNALYQK